MKMEDSMRKVSGAIMASLFLVVVLAASARAGEYPDRPVQMIVPFNPGGGSDLIIRLVEKDFQKEFGQPMSFVYKPGASGAVGVTELKSMPPDGYALASQSYPHIIIQEISGNGNFTVDDFDYIGMFARDDIFFAVRNKSPFKTLEEFIDAARSKPDTLSVATTDTMGCSHMAALELKALGIPVNLVTYTGGSKALAAVLGGHVDALMVVKGVAAPAINKLRLLAICSEARDPLVPDTPTFREKGYDIVQFNGRLIIAPKGLSDDTRKRLIEGFTKIYSSPDVQERARKSGYDIKIADGDTVKKMFNDFREDAQKLVKLAGTLK